MNLAVDVGKAAKLQASEYVTKNSAEKIISKEWLQILKSETRSMKEETEKIIWGLSKRDKYSEEQIPHFQF